jgi:hypothetical protein
MVGGIPSMDKMMNCNPDPPQDKIEGPVYVTTQGASPSGDGEKTSLAANSYESEIVEATAKDCTSTEDLQSLERDNFQGLELDLQLKEMSLKFKTRQSLEPQVYALLGQLSVLQNDLKHQQDKLDLANQTVGYLEAQVRVQQAQIDELRAISANKPAPQSNLLVKLFGRFATKP